MDLFEAIDTIVNRFSKLGLEIPIEKVVLIIIFENKKPKELLKNICRQFGIGLEEVDQICENLLSEHEDNQKLTQEVYIRINRSKSSLDNICSIVAIAYEANRGPKLPVLTRQRDRTPA